MSRLSPQYGCGLMLKGIPRYRRSDALVNIMQNYGYTTLAADKAAQRTVDNSGLLKTFFDNAFTHKMPLRTNFHTVYGQKDTFLACDPRLKAAWFIGEPQNRMALTNYCRDAVSLGLKPFGVTLTGSTVRLTALGWQNLHDLLSNDFLDSHATVKRVEVMSMLSGVRWREPHLGVGVTWLNFRDINGIREATESVLRGENNGEIQG
jgi:hypothetical protein